MLKRVFVLVAVASAMAAVAGIQDAVTLKLNLKEGQKFSSKMSAQVDFQGMAIDVSGTSITTVKSVKDGVYTLTNETKNLVIDVGGQQMEQPDDTSTMTQAANGRILKVEGAMVSDDSNRLANAFNFFYPEKAVKVGDKWENSIAEDKTLGTPGIKGTYEVVERKEWKGRDVLVLKVSQSETGDSPISLDGTFVIEIKTGIPVMSEFKFKNLPQAGMLMDGSWKTEAID